MSAFSENLANGLSTAKDSNNRTTSIGLVFMDGSTSWVPLDLGSLVGGSSNGRYINLLALSDDNKFYNADTETAAVIARQDTSKNVIIGLKTVLGDGADNSLIDNAYIKIPKEYLGATNGIATGKNADGNPAIGMADEDGNLDASVGTVPLSDIIAGITGGVEGENEWWVGLTHTVGGTSTTLLSSISFLELFGGGENNNKFVKLEASNMTRNDYDDDNGYFKWVGGSKDLQTSLKVTVGGLSDTVNLHIESAELRPAISQVLGGLSVVGDSIQLMDDQYNTFGQGVTIRDVVDPNGNEGDPLLKIAIREYATDEFIDDDAGWIYSDTTNKTIAGSGQMYYLGLKTELGQYASEPTNFILNMSGSLEGEKTNGMTIVNNGTLFRGGNQDIPDVPKDKTRIITFANQNGTGADTESTHKNNVAQVEIVNGISAYVSGNDTHLQLTYYDYDSNTTKAFGNTITLQSILNPEGGENDPVENPDVIDLNIRTGNNTEYSKLGNFYELGNDYYGDFQITLGKYVTSASIKLGSDILNNALQSIEINGDASQNTRKIALSPSVSGNENGINTSRIVSGLNVKRNDANETQLELTYIGDDDETHSFGGVNIQTLFSSYSSSTIYNPDIIDLQIKNLAEAYTDTGNFIYDADNHNLHGDFRVILGGDNGYYADASITLESSTLKNAVSDVVGGLSINNNGDGVYNLYIVDTDGERIGNGVSFSDLLGSDGKPELDIASITGSYTGATKITKNTQQPESYIYAFTMTPSVGGVTGDAVSAYLDLTDIVPEIPRPQNLYMIHIDQPNYRWIGITNGGTVPVNSIVNGLKVSYDEDDKRTISLTYNNDGTTTEFGIPIHVTDLFGVDPIKLEVAKDNKNAFAPNGNFIQDANSGDYRGYFKVSLGDLDYSEASITLSSATIQKEAKNAIGGLSFNSETGDLFIIGKDTTEQIGRSANIGTLEGIELNVSPTTYGGVDGKLNASIPISLTMQAHGKSATSNSIIDLDIIDVNKFNVSKNTAGSLVFKYDEIELPSPIDLSQEVQKATELTGIVPDRGAEDNYVLNMTQEYNYYRFNELLDVKSAFAQVYNNNKDCAQFVVQGLNDVEDPQSYREQEVNNGARVLMFNYPGITDISRSPSDARAVRFTRGSLGHIGYNTHDVNLAYYIN